MGIGRLVENLTRVAFGTRISGVIVPTPLGGYIRGGVQLNVPVLTNNPKCSGNRPVAHTPSV